MRMYLNVRVPLIDSLGSTLRPASEQSVILSVLLVLEDAFGMFLSLHL